VASSKNKATPLPLNPEKIIDIDVSTEMRGSFLEYAYSVIYSRALPDARDGLKPVQRRILYQMNEMGLRPEKGHVKSARVVGEVMGRLHPHGDGAIYDALVRMAQPFSLRLSLIDGQGNFGSLDDGPAAMRYTECKLAPAALGLTASIDEDVVDFKTNYDGREVEPEVLPAAFPNLLVNGATGIAVGMATNMPPHNLGEIVSALLALIDEPEIKPKELMKLVPGPDLPSGGKLLIGDGIKDAYLTGRGSFRMRATVQLENVKAKKQGIIVTELPFNVGAEKVVERMKDLIESKKLQGISRVIDLTDGEKGLRLVIEIKNGHEPQKVLEDLFRLTPMEESFAINNVALVEGRPRTLGLKEMLEVYLDHRINVVKRRSKFRLEKATDRMHLVEGLLLAIVDIDKVIKIIRASDDAAQAKSALMKSFKLSDIQTNFILDMPLRRLTKTSKLELQTEQKQLLTAIGELKSILGSSKKLRNVVADELAAVSKHFATPRRSMLVSESGKIISDVVRKTEDLVEI
jgi:DNA gyrase subunit A